MKIGPKPWHLKCSQCSSMIWPTDLFLHKMTHIRTWLRFFQNDHSEHFDDDWTKTVASRVFTRLSYDLTYWPSFWVWMIHIRSWPSLMKIGPKLWPLECSQCFSMSWPPDLVFDPTWTKFELDRDIVKMIILSKFDDDWTKTVASRVFTRFLYDLTYWPSFWPDMTHIQT